MDIHNVAASAVAAVAVYLQRIASGVVERVQDTAIERLYSVVSTRLRASELGARVLGELEMAPNDPARQAAVASSLADSVTPDLRGAEELRRLVENVHQEQRVASDSSVSGGANVAVGQNSTMTISRGLIAGGDVDQSRKVQVSFGGLVAIIAAVAIVAAGVGASATFVVGSANEPASSGSFGDDGLSAENSEPGQPPRLADLPKGPSIEFVDDAGYRFQLAGVRRDTTVQLTSEIAARPGTVYPYVDLVLTNLQKDRTMSITELIKWHIRIPVEKKVENSNLLPGTCGEIERQNFCDYGVACAHLNEYGMPGMEFGFDPGVMAPGATWGVRCFPSDKLAFSIKGAAAVKDSIKVSDIRLFRTVGDVTSTKVEEIRFP